MEGFNFLLRDGSFLRGAGVQLIYLTVARREVRSQHAYAAVGVEASVLEHEVTCSGVHGSLHVGHDTGDWHATATPVPASAPPSPFLLGGLKS